MELKVHFLVLRKTRKSHRIA